jgi:hypothetical protein
MRIEVDTAKIWMAIAFLLCGVAFGWWIHGGVTDIDTDIDTQNNYQAGEANGFNRGFEAGLYGKRITSENITVKYLDGVGLVVKWEGAGIPEKLELIQRFQPWLRDITGINYNITFEELSK